MHNILTLPGDMSRYSHHYCHCLHTDTTGFDFLVKHHNAHNHNSAAGIRTAVWGLGLPRQRLGPAHHGLAQGQIQLTLLLLSIITHPGAQRTVSRTGSSVWKC